MLYVEQACSFIKKIKVLFVLRGFVSQQSRLLCMLLEALKSLSLSLYVACCRSKAARHMCSCELQGIHSTTDLPLGGFSW